MKFLSLLFMVFSPVAFAAQSGNIIVNEARVFQYPRSDSAILQKLPRDTTLTVSNQPTEGFFKVRTPNGQLGWVSGQDILVAGAASNLPPPPPMSPVKKRHEEVVDPENDDGSGSNRNLRLLLGWGLTNLTYGGLKDTFEGVALMNYGTSFQVEVQKRMSHILSWAVRLEYLSTNSGDKVLDTSRTQTISNSMLPLQIGFMFNPINARKIRFGIGAYGGVALAAGTTVTQRNTSTNVEVSTKYNSTDPVGTLAAQLTWMISKNFGIFFDGAYRYQKTALFPASTALGVEGFAIDYTGYTGRMGLELRF